MDLRRAHVGGGYGSEFEYDSEHENRKRARHDLATKEGARGVTGGLPSKRFAASEYDRAEAINQRYHFLALDAYNRHKLLVNDYLLYYPGATKDIFTRDTSKDKTDLDVIRENHRFLWTEEDEAGEENSWGKRLAKKYWDKLFKEYCIVDLSCYKENKIAMRWRIEKEVVEGKGHFSCGNKRCSEQEGLRTWEVNFAYMEHGQKKNALVKLRLCERCSKKLNYHKKCKEVTKKKAAGAGKSREDEDTRSPSPKRHASKHKDKHKDRHKDKHKDKHNDRHKDKHNDRHKDKHKDKHSDRHKDKHKDKHRGSGKHRHKKHHSDRESRRGRKSSTDSEEDTREDKRGGDTSKHPAQDGPESGVPESDFWTGPAPVTEERSRAEEFDDYLKDMFM